MTTTTAATAIRLLGQVDWRTIGRRTATTARLLLAAAALLGQVAWEHRAQIRQALLAAIAATYVAGAWTRHQAERTYRAGVWAHQQLDRFSRRSAALLPQQPVAALAPITATLAAAREALERLIARLYPVLAI